MQQRLNAELNKILATPDIAKRIEDLGGEVEGRLARRPGKVDRDQHGELRGHHQGSRHQGAVSGAVRLCSGRVDVTELALRAAS